MSIAPLNRVLKSAQSPPYWRTVGGACKAVSNIVRKNPTWLARSAYALARAGDYSLAVVRYRAAIAAVDTAPATWHYQLSRCLRFDHVDIDALHHLYEACRLDSDNSAWWEQLSRYAKKHDVLNIHADALTNLVRLGVATFDDHFLLAKIWDSQGCWRDAQQLLITYLEMHSSADKLWRLLGSVSLKQHRHGGTYLKDGDELVFVYDSPGATDHAAIAVNAYMKAVEDQPRKASSIAGLGAAKLAAGDIAGGTAEYQRAVDIAQTAQGRWALASKHIWQFHLERGYARVGQRRVEDPFFDCDVMLNAGEVAYAPGQFGVRFTYVGLLVDGVTPDKGIEHVDICVNGNPVRAVRVNHDGALGRYRFELTRQTVARLPQQIQISVRDEQSRGFQHAEGGTTIDVVIPHGDGSLDLSMRNVVDKKGVVVPACTELEERQRRYLDIYEKVAAFFDESLNRPLFVIHGTLLGVVRENDFIAGDDDFDCAFLSEASDSGSVKRDVLAVMEELVKAGFTVSFNRQGRLFRVQLESEPTDGFHLDVHVIWFEGPTMYIHNKTAFASERERFLPVKQQTLRGTTVYLPADAEHWLAHQYGPSWTKPDPGFINYRDEVSPAVRKNLAQALMTAEESRKYTAKFAELSKNADGAGRFYSVGQRDLYPLNRYPD